MKAHNHSPRYASIPLTFGQRDDSLLHCNYCGSLTVADAIKALETTGTHYSGSDWKYGYPHKFYLDIPSGKPAVPYYELNGKRVSQAEYDIACADRNYGTNPQGGRSLGTGTECGTGTIHAKFYTEHLLDATPEELARFNALSRQYFCISFAVEDDNLRYQAPYRGIQQWGTIGVFEESPSKPLLGSNE